MNFDRLNFPGSVRSPAYMQNRDYFNQMQSSASSPLDFCYPQMIQHQQRPPPPQQYIEHVPITRIEQDYIPVTTQEMVPVEKKEIEYIPQITNDIHHFHETQVQPTILESKQVFTHAGLEQIPQLQKKLFCQKQKYEELLRNEQEKVSLLEKKNNFMSTNYEEQLRDQKRYIGEKDALLYKLQKEIQHLQGEESLFKDKEHDLKFFEKKIQLLKLKNKEMDLENEKQQHELDKYKEQCKDLQKKLKTQEEMNQSLQCSTVKFNEQLLMIKEQYEQEISNLKHIIDGLQLESIKLIKKNKKLSLKKCPEKSPPRIEIQKENIQKQVLMQIPQVQYQEPIIIKKKHKKKKIKAPKESPMPKVTLQPIQVMPIVKPCINPDPKMPKSVVNLYLKEFDDCCM